MTVEKDIFIGESDVELPYLEEVLDYVDNNVYNIIDFFRINNIEKKVKIVFWNDLEEYKKHINKYSNYQDYMCADTFDGNINLLSLSEAQKTKEHKDMSVENIKRNIKHEFVHICHKKYLKDRKIQEDESGRDSWIWEALATYLGNSEDFEIISFNNFIEDLEDFNTLKNNYPIAFTIGSYLFESMTDDEILGLISNRGLLQDEAPNVINTAKDWAIVQLIKQSRL